MKFDIISRTLQISAFDSGGTDSGTGGEELANATVTIKQNRIEITAGKIAAQTVVVPVVVPERDDNVFTVKEGYVNSTTLTAPEAVIEESDSQVTVGKGWVKDTVVIEKGNSSADASAVSLVKVTGYTAAQDAYSAATQVMVSGFGTHTLGDESVDYSKYNGTYNVIAEIASANSTKKRVFKHETEQMYLFRYYDNESGNGWGWFFRDTYSNASTYSCLMFNSSSGDMPAGANTWYLQEESDSVTLTLTPTVTEYPKQELVLTGSGMSGFDGYKWVSAETTGSYSGFEETPEVGAVYAVYDGALIGKKIDVDYGIVLPYKRDGYTRLVMPFAEGENRDSFLVDGSIMHHETTGTSELTFYSDGGRDVTFCEFNGGYIKVKNTDNAFLFDGDFCMEVDVYPTAASRQCIFAYDSDYLFGVCFSYDGTNDRKISVFHPGNWTDEQMSDALELNRWYHIAIQRKNGVISCYIDGVATGYTISDEATIGTDNYGETTAEHFTLGMWGDDAGDFSARWQGKMAAVRVSNKARY